MRNMKQMVAFIVFLILTMMPLTVYAISYAYATPLSPNQQSVDLPVMADAFLEDENGSGQDTNFGSGTNLIVGGRWAKTRWRGLLKFDLSSIPSGVVVDAVNLHLFLGINQVNDSITNVISVYRITKDWLESGVTWKSAKIGDPWALPGGDRDTTTLGQKVLSSSDIIGQEYVISLDTLFVQRIIDGFQLDSGIILIGTELGASTEKYLSTFHSKENSSGNMAKLNIVYSVAPISPVLSPIIGLRVTSYFPGQIGLCWDKPVELVIGYKIYRCSGYGCIPDIEIGISEGTSYSDTGLDCGEVYGYAVTGYDSSDNESEKSDFVGMRTKPCNLSSQ